MKSSLVQDLSRLSNVDVGLLTELFNKFGLCIQERVYEDRIQGDTSTEIDIGLGSLFIINDQGQERVRFVPSAPFVANIKQAEAGKPSTLRKRLEKATTAKILELFRNVD